MNFGIDCHTLAAALATDTCIVMTFWETKEHFEAWTQSAAFKEGHARAGRLPADAFRGHPKMEVMEIIQEAVAGSVLAQAG